MLVRIPIVVSSDLLRREANACFGRKKCISGHSSQIQWWTNAGKPRTFQHVPTRFHILTGNPGDNGGLHSLLAAEPQGHNYTEDKALRRPRMWLVVSNSESLTGQGSQIESWGILWCSNFSLGFLFSVSFQNCVGFDLQNKVLTQ